MRGIGLGRWPWIDNLLHHHHHHHHQQQEDCSSSSSPLGRVVYVVTTSAPTLLVFLISTVGAAIALVSLFRMAMGRAKLDYYYYHHHGQQQQQEQTSRTGVKLHRVKKQRSGTTDTIGQASESQGGNDTPILFSDLIRSHIVPACHGLNPFLFNGHLQTMNTVSPWQSDPAMPIYYGRRVFEHEDARFAGSFAVDFVIGEAAFDAGTRKGDEREAGEELPSRTRHLARDELERMDAGEDDNRPMLVVLHGLSGGSHELYLRHVIARLLLPSRAEKGDGEDGGRGEEQKWEVCVVNSRGCANSTVTSSILYNARATWDLRQTVRWLKGKFPNRPLFAVGFSLGANILTNYLGEEGERCEFRAAMLVSNPWNLEVGSVALQRSWLGLHVYSRAMGTNMKKLLQKHVAQISKNPRVDIAKVMTRCSYLHEFDREVQGPTWGYPTEGAYYRDASSSDSLLAIRIPFFALHAVDDPIAVDEALPRQEFQQTPYGVLCTTSLGGHLGWFELGGERWFARVADTFFRTMAFDVDLSQAPLIEGAMHDAAQEKEAWKPSFEPMRRKMHVRVDAFGHQHNS